jgi:hypothetical protein
MAGSLSHIVDENGAFTMSNIENMGDAHEALEECFDIIAALLATGCRSSRKNDSRAWLASVCRRCKAPKPNALPKFGKRDE